MFYAIRHGETDNNKKGIVQGAGTNSSLNKTGEQQAKDLSKKLLNLNIDIIYSSDMIRSIQTTEIINELLQRHVFYTPLLRETHYGEIEGMVSLEVDTDERYKHICEQVDDKNNPARHDVCFPGGETRNIVAKRLLTCLSHINHEGKNVLLSTHGGLLRSFACIHNGEDIKMPNCGGLRFDITPEGLPVDIEML